MTFIGIKNIYMTRIHMELVWWLMTLEKSINISTLGYQFASWSRKYPAKTITDAYYADDIAILANTPNQAETLLHSLEWAVAGIGLHVNAHKIEYMCYNQTGDISILDGTPLKLVDKFTYLGSSVSSTEKDINTRLTKAWTAINRVLIIWKSDLTDKMKCSFFQAAVVSILLYGCTTWTITKRVEKKLDSNYTRMLWAILNKSWRQHPTRHQLYGHLPPITKTIQVRWTRHAGHCWRSRDELISDVLLWTPTYGLAKAGRPARTYIQQLCEDMGCSPEDLPEVMNDREKWRERVRDIRASGTTWWWWFIPVIQQIYENFHFIWWHISLPHLQYHEIIWAKSISNIWNLGKHLSSDIKPIWLYKSDWSINWMLWVWLGIPKNSIDSVAQCLLKYLMECINQIFFQCATDQYHIKNTWRLN